MTECAPSKHEMQIGLRHWSGTSTAISTIRQRRECVKLPDGRWRPQSTHRMSIDEALPLADAQVPDVIVRCGR